MVRLVIFPAPAIEGVIRSRWYDSHGRPGCLITKVDGSMVIWLGPIQPSNKHYCYLLRSLNPQYLRRTYIGYTVNPARRLRQHNRDIKGGAHKTWRAQPWAMVCHISGFPDARTARQYEWINHHPPHKRWCLRGRITTLAETLMMVKWTATAPLVGSMNLVLTWLQPGHCLPFKPDNCQEVWF